MTSAADFVHPFAEAARRFYAEVLTEDELVVWLPDFLSELTLESPVLTPVEILDFTDGQHPGTPGLIPPRRRHGLCEHRRHPRLHDSLRRVRTVRLWP